MSSDNSRKVSLMKKLGIKEGFRIAIIQAPPSYVETLGKLPFRASLEEDKVAKGGEFNLIHFFAKRLVDLEREFPKIPPKLSRDGMLWISWPKKSSGVKTDLSDNCVRKVGLDNEMVDVKVAAIDETWSALKFVFRKIRN
ncbi:MAG: DUF3052 domain-containing protein [Nitrososphaerales archaeon]